MHEEAVFTPLKQIHVPGGDVFHALKKSEDSFRGFGEAYFSFVEKDVVKGWKRHSRMYCNLIVPVGLVTFNCISPDGRASIFRLGSGTGGGYGRLTIPPGYWFGFGGCFEPTSCILNIADILHEPDEGEKQPMEAFTWQW